MAEGVHAGPGEAHTKVEHWIATPMLVVDGPTTGWQDVMVRPPGKHEQGRCLCVEVLALSALDAEERQERGDGCGVFPETMSVLLDEPFDNERALERVGACMRAAGIPLKELREVSHDAFFDF